MQKVQARRKTSVAAYVICGFLLILADALFIVRIAHAAPAYTPYANAVTAQSAVTNGTANNATGAPDNQYATFVGANPSITLDMGEGEEGTNSLKVYFGQINIQSTANVEFLDNSQAVIASEQRSLFLDINPSNQTFAYDWHTSKKAYRYVRLSSLAGTGFRIDSIEALGFIGSSATQDTDGDGVPDREDGDPLVFNPKTTPSGGGGSNNGGSNTTTNTVIRTTTATTTAGSTNTVNAPPAAVNDKDGDQMDDAWETAHNLDPNSSADASADPDVDGLTNLREYQFDTDPHVMDTDQDGIPDGWEVDHGLNAKVDDAVQDPDQDYITNLGEYHFDTNPYRADDIEKLAAKLHGGVTVWNWVVFTVLLLLAAGAFAKARMGATIKQKAKK